MDTEVVIVDGSPARLLKSHLVESPAKDLSLFMEQDIPSKHMNKEI